MTIKDIVAHLETIAPPSYQESYDNAGLITGSLTWNCSGILVCLDTTEDVVQEAVDRNCNMIVAHHPVVFNGLKRFNGTNYVERTIIKALKNDIAIYAIHTNLDNVIKGVNGKMADMLALVNRQVLLPRQNDLMKLYTFVPIEQAEMVRQALFAAGAGNIGNYYDCSFNSEGMGTFTAGAGTKPFIGSQGKQEMTPEMKVEVVFPAFNRNNIVEALKKAHPYEEVAYDLVALFNSWQQTGSGLLGELPEPLEEKDFLGLLQLKFNLKAIRHTPLLSKKIKKVALCGGAGSFLIAKALASGADVFVTSDIKYHEFFDANASLVVADIGHYESEQFTIDLLITVLQEKFPTFAVLKTGINTNPVHYFL
ncbi:MAG: Nif3-like dinuclear metal center hexameric protein [Chitinophagaceae bacterium]|nr:Nif3-like dinuclear metal center hexameric protein [Chitinophagaceae bacterium]